jgi:ipoprotein LpqH
MPRFMVGVTAAAIVIAALAGCSSNKSSTSSSSSSSAASSAGASGTASPQQNRVLVDGQDQGAVEHVRCGTFNDGIGIKIGMGDHGVEVLLSNTDPPGVQSVHFSNILIGGVEADVGLDYEPGQNEGDAQATNQGNTYKITGTATSSNATKPGSKSFEIDVTCP